MYYIYFPAEKSYSLFLRAFRTTICVALKNCYGDFCDKAFLQSVNRSLREDKLDKRMNKIV